MSPLDASYAHCVRVARERARNFYFSFLVLPRRKRLAMCAIYAFMRQCDDLSDEQGASREALDAWRAELAETLEGGAAAHPLWPAFGDVVRTYGIPARYFHEIIDGVSSDLEPRSFETFDDLYRYCYLVASVVGLTTLHVFGFDHPRALALGEKCGIALQLTNIIRDVREDTALGRVYLPREDLRRFGVTLEMLSGQTTTTELRALLEFEGARARSYYEASRPLLELTHADARPALWAMIEIYARLLARIRERRYEVMRGRISLSTAEKMGVLGRAWMKRLAG